MKAYAGIYLLEIPYSIDHAYDYFIPLHLRDVIKTGDFCAVPFGTNRTKIGIITRISDKPESEFAEYKPILSLGDRRLSLTDETLGLAFFLKEQTLCTLGEAVRSMVPTFVLSRLVESYRISEKPVCLGDDVSSITMLIYDYIRRKECVSTESLKAKFGSATGRCLKELMNNGTVYREFEFKTTSVKTENFYSLAISRFTAENIAEGTDEKIKLRSQRHKDILSYFINSDETDISEKCLTETFEGGVAAIRALCDKGIIAKNPVQIDRGLVYTEKTEHDETAALTLCDEQRAAYEMLAELSDSEEAKAALLFGVTGSGKTCVMLKIIDRVLEKGKSVIVLLPEIALTPQSAGIFSTRYKNRVSIIHSGLSAGERFDTYNRIKSGESDVVVGTRSAIFAPLSNLGLIIIDEEQEHTYKSDMNPKYHTRDVARYRAAHNKALMLLASATPSLESYLKATQGKYTLIKLKNRFGSAVLPSTTIVDMRKESGGALAPIGSLLAEKLSENYKNENQSILFLNRRGYNNILSCRDCGEAVRCESCSISVTYHTTDSRYDNGILKCHWCGKRFPVPENCPVCGGKHLLKSGYGTQRVEQELYSLIPKARILRMDTDSVGAKNSYDELLGSFKRHEADVLLGTQMVTKGHDFADVTLVGVLLADSSLYLDDYRANERTFALITQVIGRAGRSKKRGEALIQTNNPDNDCIKLACCQDYESFYEHEIRLRRALSFPPFCDIALLTLTSPFEKDAKTAAGILFELFKRLNSEEYGDVPVQAFGPFEAPVFRVENKYRMRMIIKCRLNKRSRAMFSELLVAFAKSGVKDMALSCDFNPSTV